MVYATVSDVTARYEGSADSARVQVLLDDVHDILARWQDDIDARLADGSLRAATLKRVIASAVMRYLRNPSGFQSEHAGEVGYSYGVKAAESAGRLRFTDDELAELGIGSSVPVGSFRLGWPVYGGVCGPVSEASRAGGRWC